MVQSIEASLVGREHEIEVTRAFIRDIQQGPASLLLEGLAGIGKTAIWNRSLQEARAADVSIRTCRCTQSDAAWAFAGLGDLLEGLGDELLAELPEVQRRALSAALLLSDAEEVSSGSRVVGVAVLGALRGLARSRPLLLAIDDIQWLDPSSRNVLSYALRRLTDEPVRLLASWRSGPAPDAVDLGLPGERLLIGGVSIGIMQRIVSTRLSQTLSRPTLTRLHQATGGNPMMCLEMARAIQRRGDEPEVGEPLTVPADLRVLVADRLSGLTEGAQWVLLVSAALAQPTLTALVAESGRPDATAQSLHEALAAGVLELDGERIRFTHPLIASIPYADLTPAARRDLHQRIAASVSDVEERARHAALGTTQRSADVALALDVAARQARRRGSLDAAAELAELAVARTPADDLDGMLRRTVDAAELLVLLGELSKARSILTVGLDAAPHGPSRVRGLLLQATIASWGEGDASVASWCAQAVLEAGDDELLLARCFATLAETSPSGAAQDLANAEHALDLLESMAEPPPDLLANALTNVAVHRCRLGQGLAVATLERAVTLQAQADPVPVSDRAALGLGMYLKVVDQFDESRRWLLAMRTCAADEGDDSALPTLLGHLAMLECWAGDYRSALDYAVDGRNHAARMGIRAPMPTSAHVLALAHLGRLDEARTLGQADAAADDALGYVSAVALHLRSLGFTELLAGNADEAAAHLLRALTISSEEVGIGEPAILRLHGDAVAALVTLGRLDEAQRLTDQLDTSVLLNGLPWASALAGRCRGLLSAAAGDVPAALECLERALSAHGRLPMPFEEARTRLLFGGVLRRAGRRTDARRELTEARAVFVRLGTPILEAQADLELASLGGRRAEGELTPVEERIAALVSAGQTNREVAGTLFMSVRTVESHLGRIYRKLGLRSRTELARRLSS